MSNPPPNNFEKQWGVYKEDDGWYYYDWRGEPYGPFDNLNAAWDALDDYAYDYDTRDE